MNQIFSTVGDAYNGSAHLETKAGEIVVPYKGKDQVSSIQRRAIALMRTACSPKTEICGADAIGGRATGELWLKASCATEKCPLLASAEPRLDVRSHTESMSINIRQ